MLVFMASKKRKVTEDNGRFFTPRGVELTRNAHTMTEAEYFSMILSALRGTTRFWKPCLLTLEAAKRKNEGSNKRLKYEYQCATCSGWFARKLVQIDHIVPCGGINGYDKILPWILLAHVEDGFQVLCKGCHKQKTGVERNAKSNR